MAIERNIETVFVGDSSLGNSINAKLFSVLSGTKTVNIALNGHYGFAGSYNMLRRAVSKHKDSIERVIVMHTVDMMKRPISYVGYLLTVGGVSDVFGLQKKERGEVIRAFYNFVLSPSNVAAIGRSLLGKSVVRPIENDYIKQQDVFDRRSASNIILRPPLEERKAFFLRKLIEYSKERSIDVIYVHGPLWKPIVDASKEYLRTLNKELSKYDMILIENVLAIGDEELGDSEDHVAPAFKDMYTSKYYDLLEPYL